MDPRVKTIFETKAKVLKALTHPTRLFIEEFIDHILKDNARFLSRVE